MYECFFRLYVCVPSECLVHWEVRNWVSDPSRPGVTDSVNCHGAVLKIEPSSDSRTSILNLPSHFSSFPNLIFIPVHRFGLNQNYGVDKSFNR